MNLRTFVSTLGAALSLAGALLAGPEPVKISWTPEPGDSVAYDVRLSHLSPRGLIEVRYASTETVAESPPGKIVIRRDNGEPSVTVAGRENSNVQVGIPDRTLHFSERGYFLSAVGASPRGGRLESLVSLVYSPVEVRPGDTWVYGQDENPESGARKTKFIYTFHGPEEYFGRPAYRIGVQLEESSGAARASGAGTVWVARDGGQRLGEVYSVKNVDLGLGPMRAKLVREPRREGSADGPAAGRWRGELTAPTGEPLEIWVELKPGGDGEPALTLHTIATESPFAFSAPAAAVSFESGELHYRPDLLGHAYECRLRFLNFLEAESHCRAEDGVLRFTLERTLDTPWAPADLEVVAAGAGQQRFVDAMREAVLAVAADDYQRFDQLFVDNPRGMQPNEIWRAAARVLARFGKIRKIEFASLESPGAFVKVTFDRAQREFYLQLDEGGKLAELTYVPPATPHEH